MDEDTNFLDQKSSYVKKYRDYLSAKKIPHENFSDEQILYSYGKKAEAAGKLEQMPELARLYRRSNAELQRQENGFLNLPIQFYEGLKKGGNTAGGMVAGGLSVLGDTYNQALQGVGLDEDGTAYSLLKARSPDALADASQSFMQDAGRAKTNVKSVKDIENFEDTVDFLSAGLGEVLPTMGTIMVAGATTGGLAPIALRAAPQLLQKKIVGRALQNEIKKLGPSKASASLLADRGKAFSALGGQGQAVAKAYASQWGNVAGGVAASGTMGMGEVYNSLLPFTQLPEGHKDYIPKGDALAYSWAFGSAIGALDSLVPSMLGSKVLRKFYPSKTRITPIDAARADAYVKKSLLKAVGMGMAIEGTTEAAQEYLSITADKFAKARQDKETTFGEDVASSFENPLTEFSDEEVWRLVDAGVLGAIGGTFAGGVFTAIDNQYSLPKRVDAQQKAQRARDQALVTSAAAQSDVQAEIIEKAKKQLERKQLAEGDFVVLANGQEATYVRPVGGGRALVRYKNEEGKTVEPTIPMAYMTPKLELESDIINRANRRQAMEQIASQPVAPAQEPAPEEKTSVVEEFKQEAKQEETEDTSSEPIEDEALTLGFRSRKNDGDDSTKHEFATDVQVKLAEARIKQGIKNGKTNEEIVRDLVTYGFLPVSTHSELEGGGLKEFERDSFSSHFASVGGGDARHGVLARQVIEKIRNGESLANLVRKPGELTSKNQPVDTVAEAKKTREAVEKGVNVTRGDLLAYRVLEDSGIFESDLTTERLIDGEITESLRKEISTEHYNAWRKQTYDKKETQPSKKEFIEAFRRAHKVLNPDGKPTEGDKLAEETALSVEKAQQEQEKKKVEEEEKKALEKAEEQRIARQVDLQKSKYKQGDKVKLSKSGATTAVKDFGLPLNLVDAEWQIDSIDTANGTMQVSTDGYTIKAGDPQGFTSPIKETEAKTPAVLTPAPPAEIEAYKRESVQQQGEDMEVLPGVQNGIYVVRYGNKTARIKVDEDGWEFLKGGTVGDTPSRPQSLAGVISRATRGLPYDVTSIRFEDAYEIGVSFDGVAFTFNLKQPIVEGIPLDSDEENGIWIYDGSRKEETDLNDSSQKHLQVKGISKISGEGTIRQVREALIESNKSTGKRKIPLPPVENKNVSGSASSAIIAIRHEGTQQVFVRTVKAKGSVKANTASISIQNFKRKNTKQVSALPSAGTLDLEELPDGFTPLELVVFSARPGKLRMKFDNEASYIAWLTGIPKFEIETDNTNLPIVSDLISEWNAGNTERVVDFDLHFRNVYEEGEARLAQEDGELVVSESIGAYIEREGSRPAWHFLKIEDIEAQLDLSALYRKIDDILSDPKRDKGELAEEGVDKLLEFLRIGDSTEDDNGDAQIDKRVFSEYFSKAQANGSPIVSNQNRKIIARSLVNAIYERQKRRGGDGTMRESGSIVTEEGERLIENVAGEDKTPALSVTESEILSTFEGLDPIQAARRVFFPNFTIGQLKVVYDVAIQTSASDPEVTREQLIEKTGADLETLQLIDRIPPEARGELRSFLEILGNVEQPTQGTINEAMAYLRWVADNYAPIEIDDIIRQQSPSVTLSADEAFEAESRAYAQAEIVVRNNFEPVAKKYLAEGQKLTPEQRELLSSAYTSILKSVRRPDESTLEIQEAFLAIAESFDLDGVAGFSALENSKVKNKKDFLDTIQESSEMTEDAINLFIDYLESVRKQVLPQSAIHFTRMMAEHLGLAESAPLTTMRNEFSKSEIVSGAIDSNTRAPNKAPIENMQDPYGSQSIPSFPEVTDESIEHGDKIASAQKSNLVQFAPVSEEQRIRNSVAMDEVFPPDLPGSNMSGIALESIGKIINDQGVPESAEFMGELHALLTRMLEARNDKGLPPIRFDNTTTIPSTPGTLTRGQFIPDFERPTILVSPDFYLGKNDGIGEPFKITGNKEKDILMLVSMHEIWHGTMEESLHAHEQKIARGEVSEVQEIIDLIDEVIKEAKGAAEGTKFSSVFMAANKDSRREILNRAWNRRDFAEFLASVKVSEDLQQRIDKNGEGFISSLLDALYSAYLKLLKMLGIDTDGTALKSILDLNRRLDAAHRKLEPNDNQYDVPEGALAAMAEAPAPALYSKLIQVLNKPTELQQEDDTVALRQEVNSLQKQIAPLMKQGKREEAQAIIARKAELDALLKDAKPKKVSNLPEKAKASKWIELLVKAGVSRAELDYTIAPVLESISNQEVKKGQLVELAQAADQSRVVSKIITDQLGEKAEGSDWYGSAFNPEFSTYVTSFKKPLQHFEIKLATPQFTPVSAVDALIFKGEEMGDISYGEDADQFHDSQYNTYDYDQLFAFNYLREVTDPKNIGASAKRAKSLQKLVQRIHIGGFNFTLFEVNGVHYAVLNSDQQDIQYQKVHDSIYSRAEDERFLNRPNLWADEYLGSLGIRSLLERDDKLNSSVIDRAADIGEAIFKESKLLPEIPYMSIDLGNGMTIQRVRIGRTVGSSNEYDKLATTTAYRLQTLNVSDEEYARAADILTDSDAIRELNLYRSGDPGDYGIRINMFDAAELIMDAHKSGRSITATSPSRLNRLNFRGNNIFNEYSARVANHSRDSVNNINEVYLSTVKPSSNTLTPAKMRRFANKLIAWKQRYGVEKDMGALIMLGDTKDSGTKKISELLNKLGIENDVIDTNQSRAGLIEIKELSDDKLFEAQLKDSFGNLSARGQNREVRNVNWQEHFDPIQSKSVMHHIRGGIYEDGITIFESQSDVDQAAQQDLIGRLEPPPTAGKNYYKDNFPSVFADKWVYNEDKTYEKGDVVVEENSIFVAQEAIPRNTPPISTIKNSEIMPFSKWRMLGKRKSGLTRGYLGNSGRDAFKSIDGTNLYYFNDSSIIHMNKELVALLAKEEGVVVNGNEITANPALFPENQGRSDIQDNYDLYAFEKIELFGGIQIEELFESERVDPESDKKELFQRLKEGNTRGPVNSKPSILKEANELTTLKAVLRLAAERGINKITIGRGDTVFPDVTFEPKVSRAVDAAKGGFVKYQGIQQAYIRTAQKLAKLAGVPLEEVELDTAEADAQLIIEGFYKERNNVETDELGVTSSTDTMANSFLDVDFVSNNPIKQSLLFDKSAYLDDPTDSPGIVINGKEKYLSELDEEKFFSHDTLNGKWIISRDTTDSTLALGNKLAYVSTWSVENHDDPNDYQVSDITGIKTTESDRADEIRQDIKFNHYLSELYRYRGGFRDKISERMDRAHNDGLDVPYGYMLKTELSEDGYIHSKTEEAYRGFKKNFNGYTVSSGGYELMFAKNPSDSGDGFGSTPMDPNYEFTSRVEFDVNEMELREAIPPSDNFTYSMPIKMIPVGITNVYSDTFGEAEIDDVVALLDNFYNSFGEKASFMKRSTTPYIVEGSSNAVFLIDNNAWDNSILKEIGHDDTWVTGWSGGESGVGQLLEQHTDDTAKKLPYEEAFKGGLRRSVVEGMVAFHELGKFYKRFGDKKVANGLTLTVVNEEGEPVYATNFSRFDNWETLRLDFSRATTGKLGEILTDGRENTWYKPENQKKTFAVDIPDARLQQNLQEGERMLMQDDIDKVRASTRTHISIEKVGDDQYKIEGLPKEEILSAREIREGLVRLKEVPSRVGVLQLGDNGKPLTREGYHLFREGDIKTWVPSSELEAYDKDDIAEMSDQMDLNFQGKVDNSTNYIVLENQNTDLKKGQVLPRHKANLYRGSGVIFKRYDIHLAEKEAGEKVIEDVPDVALIDTSVEANVPLVKYLAYNFPWGSYNLKDYADLVEKAYNKFGIPKHRIRKEIDSIENLFAITPNDKRDKFQWLAINKGLKVPPNRLSDYMSDPTMSPPEGQGLQGNVLPEVNTIAYNKAKAAAVNEASIPVGYAAQVIRKILDDPTLSVDKIWSKYLKGGTPTKQLQKLVKKYGDEMEFQTIELHKNSENTRDQARVDALNMVEKQIRHILKSMADIDADLDPSRAKSIASRIAKYQDRTILDEAHMFDRSRYGDKVRERIDARVATTKQVLVEETGQEKTDLILNAFRSITGKEKTDEAFRKSLENAVSSAKGGGISSSTIADLILEVSKVQDVEKLDAKSIYEIIEPNFTDKGRAIILSSILDLKKDFIYLAKLSQGTDIKGRRDLSSKLQSLSRATMDELKVLTSADARSYFPMGGRVEKAIQLQFAKDRYNLLKAEQDRVDALVDKEVYSELLKEYDVESKRLAMLLGHNPAKQLNDGDMFPVMTKIEDGYTMSEVPVRMSNLMQFENYDEIKAAIRLNKEYLRDPQSKEDPSYKYIKQMTMNAEILPIWTAQYETGGMFRMNALKSSRERFQNMGPLGREIAQMINRFETAYKSSVPEARALAREWNAAFDRARKAFGFKEGHEFMDQVIGPIIKWNEDQMQLSGDKKRFQKEAWDYSQKLVQRDNLSDDAEAALLALFDEYEASADFHVGLARSVGLKVRDDKVRMRDMMGRPFEKDTEYGDYLFRDPITRGYITVPRLLRSDAIQSLVGQLPKYGWADEALWENLKNTMKSKEFSAESKANLIEDAVDGLVNEYSWYRFMTPYIRNTSPIELFYTAGKKKMPIPRHVVMDALEETAEMNGSDAFNAWVEGVYERTEHKPDRSDFLDFKYGILKAYKGRFTNLNNAIADMGKKGMDASITLAGHLMDSRSQESRIPQEFLRYTTYDEVTSPALVAKTMENAFFGRNAELLIEKMNQLQEQLEIKRNKMEALVTYIGGVKNPRGVTTVKSKDKRKAYRELEVNPEFEDVPGKTGKEKLANLENSMKQMKSLLGSEVGEGARKHLEAYLNGDLGPFQDEKILYELLGLNAYFVLNQPKSGITNLMSIWDFDSRYGGAVGKTNIASMVHGSLAAAGELLGGFLANFGVDPGTQGVEAEILMPIFFNTHENDVGLRKNLLNVGSGAVKAGAKDVFKYDILRRFKSLIDQDSLRGAKITTKDGRRKYAPFSTRTLFTKPFSYFGALANHSIAVANARTVSKLVYETAKFLEANTLPEDYQVTSEDLGKKRSDKIAYERLNQDLEAYGMGTISNIARGYLERRAGGDKRILTKEQIITSGLIGVNEVALEGGFSTTPAFLNSKYMRWAAPLQKWALNKVKQMNEGIRDQETGKVDAQAALLMLTTIVALKIPIGLAYTFFWSDWYDEELLGKASPLRPLPKSAMIPLIGPFIDGDPANNLKAMLERVARAGNVGGMALDAANTLYNGVDTYSYNRGFSLDSRIMLMSQATNIAQAMRNWIHMDFDVDYANVTRPIFYSMGLNGPLQQINLISNLFGFDNEERRISNQIGNRHKLRAGIHLLGIESRPMVGGTIGKTRFSAAVRRMERTAEADDYKGFNVAYQEAIQASIDRGDEDPEGTVIKAFKRRNLRTGISRYKLSDDEWANILSLYTDEAAQSLIDAMTMHEKYADILDASKPSRRKVKPFKPTAPMTYEELIRRSLSY